MSDKIKVNSENTPPRKNLATLGQVKDALDKKDEKIDSLKFPLDNILSPNLYNPADAKENTAINQDDGTEISSKMERIKDSYTW